MTAEPLDIDAERTAHDITCVYCRKHGRCQTGRLLAEVDRLRAALATARRDALTEAADEADAVDYEFVRDWLRTRAAQEEDR